MIRISNNFKLFGSYKRNFCKKMELPLKKEKWFDRHLDPNVIKIHNLNFKNIDLEIEIMQLKIKIKELNKEIIKILSETNI